jgi:DMSO/TMAO reductase YedYZ heme-binding membrane subunit
MFGMFHGLLLLGDAKVSYNLRGILIPFTSHYLPLQTGFGTIALYVMAILVISSRMIKRIGRKFWRVIHFLSFPGYVFALYHGISMGTDSQYSEIKLLYGITGGIVLALVLFRLTRTSPKRAPASAGRGAAQNAKSY